jgi:hypothetical protein
MGYLIELAINLKKNTQVSEIKEAIRSSANKNNCCFMYDTYEYIVNNRYHYRNHCIISLEFPDVDETFISFIKSIKRMRRVHIEMLSHENMKNSIMYASPKYLKMMEKDMAKSYLKAKKTKSLFKYDSEIMKIIRKRN